MSEKSIPKLSPAGVASIIAGRIFDTRRENEISVTLNRVKGDPQLTVDCNSICTLIVDFHTREIKILKIRNHLQFRVVDRIEISTENMNLAMELFLAEIAGQVPGSVTAYSASPGDLMNSNDAVEAFLSLPTYTNPTVELADSAMTAADLAAAWAAIRKHGTLRDVSPNDVARKVLLRADEPRFRDGVMVWVQLLRH